jgi:hypothetical protein
MIGNKGYRGTEKGRLRSGYFSRSTNSESPVSKKKIQKTGADPQSAGFSKNCERCECGDQMHIALEMIGREGVGALVYLPQEGRGILLGGVAGHAGLFSTADDLANQIHLKPIACRRLLMAIASLNLVKYERGKFQNTELGQFCTSRSKVNLGAVSQISPFDRLSEYLTDALREYSPRYQQALGVPPQDVFATLYADPVGLREFAKLMDGLSIPQGQVIAECFDFSALHCIMDVAGGPGGQASVRISLFKTL